jgi:hypothetical protein
VEMSTRAHERADLAEKTRRQIERLRSASALRRRLTPGSPLYAVALDTEEELARSLWRKVDEEPRRPQSSD